ncbi:sodium/proton-translocating pyrophosphatase, partial [Capnocytophaga leadbetteri]
MDKMMLYLPLALAILGLIFMITKALWVNKQTTGNERMQSISKSIKEGAMAFLNAEYRILGIFVVIAAIALFIVSR